MGSNGTECLPTQSGDFMETDEIAHTVSVCRSNILDDVARSNAFFKSQQRGEKDLTFEEKREIAENLLDRSKAIFLQRYWKYVNVRDLAFFDNEAADYEVSYYLEEIKVLSDSKKAQAKVKNRRYEALKKMVNEGSYFSDDEMKHRNPFLYDNLIGQHLTESERTEARRKQTSIESFSGFLMEQIDRNYMNNLSKMQEEAEDCSKEENDDDTEEEEEEQEEDDDQEIFGRVNPSSCLSGSEKERLRTEFTNIMYESFLSGNDKEFDYSSIDNNTEYDSVQEREVDEEEKYFDEDSSEPTTCES